MAAAAAHSSGWGTRKRYMHSGLFAKCGIGSWHNAKCWDDRMNITGSFLPNIIGYNFNVWEVLLDRAKAGHSPFPPLLPVTPGWVPLRLLDPPRTQCSTTVAWRQGCEPGLARDPPKHASTSSLTDCGQAQCGPLSAVCCSVFQSLWNLTRKLAASNLEYWRKKPGRVLMWLLKGTVGNI